MKTLRGMRNSPRVLCSRASLLRENKAFARKLPPDPERRLPLGRSSALEMKPGREMSLGAPKISCSRASLTPMMAITSAASKLQEALCLFPILSFSVSAR
ncbi:hypothetical protein [Methylorubrum thiocyanatum]|jgi:hypothetical protein